MRRKTARRNVLFARTNPIPLRDGNIRKILPALAAARSKQDDHPSAQNARRAEGASNIQH